MLPLTMYTRLRDSGGSVSRPTGFGLRVYKGQQGCGSSWVQGLGFRVGCTTSSAARSYGLHRAIVCL